MQDEKQNVYTISLSFVLRGRSQAKISEINQ